MQRVLFILLCLITGLTIQTQNSYISVNTTGDQPAAGAMLDIKTTNAGMLIPRMSAAERNRIAPPTASLLICQTDQLPGYYYNAGNPQVPDRKELGTTNEPAGGKGSGLSHCIGEFAQGGIIAHLWNEVTQTDHGLVKYLTIPCSTSMLLQGLPTSRRRIIIASGP